MMKSVSSSVFLLYFLEGALWQETTGLTVPFWKERYERLLAQTKDFLTAIQRAPEKIKAFHDRILHTERTEPKPKKQRETIITK